MQARRVSAHCRKAKLRLGAARAMVAGVPIVPRRSGGPACHRRRETGTLVRWRRGSLAKARRRLSTNRTAAPTYGRRWRRSGALCRVRAVRRLPRCTERRARTSRADTGVSAVHVDAAYGKPARPDSARVPAGPEEWDAPTRAGRPRKRSWDVSCASRLRSEAASRRSTGAGSGRAIRSIRARGEALYREIVNRRSVPTTRRSSLTREAARVLAADGWTGSRCLDAIGNGTEFAPGRGRGWPCAAHTPGVPWGVRNHQEAMHLDGGVKGVSRYPQRADPSGEGAVRCRSARIRAELGLPADAAFCHGRKRQRAQGQGHRRARSRD